MTVIVLFLLRPKLLHAIACKDAPFLPLLLFFFDETEVSFYRNASIGDTFPARRAGRKHETVTVSHAKIADPMKIIGFAETEISPSTIPNKTGTSTMPSK